MAETIRYSAFGYPMAEQDAAGNWQVGAPDSVSDGEWGTFRIEIGATWQTGTAIGTATLGTAGTDITTINDAPISSACSLVGFTSHPSLLACTTRT